MAESGPSFDDAFRTRLSELFRWRRDVRRFERRALPAGTVERLLDAACCAPSVGLAQPWRFVIVDDPARRSDIADAFRASNEEALRSYDGDAARQYARLKLEGLAEAPSHLAVFADRATEQGHGLGRRTMPEMADYSAVTAVYTLWLLARAEGIGMGWVSILDPERVASILAVPRAWRFIGYFCLGYPLAAGAVPELELEHWERRRGVCEFLLRR
jgi:5,6-dimethylbenzimidazole synthase